MVIWRQGSLPEPSLITPLRWSVLHPPVHASLIEYIGVSEVTSTSLESEKMCPYADQWVGYLQTGLCQTLHPQPSGEKCYWQYRRDSRKVPLTVLKNTGLLADALQQQFPMIVRYTVMSEETAQNQDQSIGLDFYITTAKGQNCLSVSYMACGLTFL